MQKHQENTGQTRCLADDHGKDYMPPSQTVIAKAQTASGAASPGIRLVFMAKGMYLEKVLSWDDQTVSMGRDFNNDIYIPEKSVLQRHLQLKIQNGSMMIKAARGKGSNSLNPLEFQEEREVRFYDTIKLGNVKCSILPDIGVSFTTPQNRPKNESVWRIRFLAALLFVLSGLFFVFQPDRFPVEEDIPHNTQPLQSAKISSDEKENPRQTEQVLPDESEPPAQKEDNQARIQELAQMANTLINNEKWHEALSVMQELKKISPDFQNIDQDIQFVTFEARNVEELTKGYHLMEEKAYKEAIRFFEAVEPESLYHEDAQDMIADIKNRQSEARKKAKRKPSKKTAGKPKAQNKEEPAANPESIEAYAEQREVMESQVLSFYTKGDLGSALRVLSDIAATGASPDHPMMMWANRLSKQIKTMAALSKKAIQAFHENQADISLRRWDQLLFLDALIVESKNSFFSDQAKLYIQSLLYTKAAAWFEKEEYSHARKDCDKLLSLNPEHEKGLVLHKKLNAVGEKFLDEGNLYFTVNPELAEKQLSKAVDICSADTKCYREAEKKLDKLR